MSGFHLRHMQPDDRDEVSRLIFHSTNQYYLSIGRAEIFQGDDLAASAIFDVYADLDPGQGLVAVDDESGQIIGSCFVHPRETHVSLGIMNAHPDHFGRGVARAILQRIIDDAQAAVKSVRLVSSLFNLDSYSLYTRAGFTPFCTFQDMYLSVPEGGLAHDAPSGVTVREATPEDVDAMASLELSVSGISRVADYRYFIVNDSGLWHVSVIASTTGGLDGFLVSCGAEALNMLGPGVARTEQQTAALVHAELNRHAGRSPVFLLPVHCGELVRTLYDWGARNCEMHVAQVHGEGNSPDGVVMPTFLPETG